MAKFKKHDTYLSEKLLQYTPEDERYSSSTYVDFKNMPIDKETLKEIESVCHSRTTQMTHEMMFKLLVDTINGLHKRLLELERKGDEFKKI